MIAELSARMGSFTQMATVDTLLQAVHTTRIMIVGSLDRRQAILTVALPTVDPVERCIQTMIAPRLTPTMIAGCRAGVLFLILIILSSLHAKSHGCEI
jgi:hypothetical protein